MAQEGKGLYGGAKSMASKWMSEVFYFQNKNTGRIVDIMLREQMEQLKNDAAWEQTTRDRFEEVVYGRTRKQKI